MLRFLEWLYELSFGWKLVVLSSVLIITIGTPYFKEIRLFIKHLIKGNRLKIEHSGIKYLHDYSIGKDATGRLITIKCDVPNTVIEGGTVVLFWQGKGIIWSRLSPFKKRLFGNSAEVKVTKEVNSFDLTLYGVFARKKIRFEIPKSHIKRLELREYVRENTGIRQAPVLNTTRFTEKVLNRLEIGSLEPINKIISKGVSSGINESINCFSKRNTPIMNYEFSTKKYKNLNKENN